MSHGQGIRRRVVESGNRHSFPPGFLRNRGSRYALCFYRMEKCRNGRSGFAMHRGASDSVQRDRPTSWKKEKQGGSEPVNYPQFEKKNDPALEMSRPPTIFKEENSVARNIPILRYSKRRKLRVLANTRKRNAPTGKTPLEIPP